MTYEEFRQCKDKYELTSGECTYLSNLFDATGYYPIVFNEEEVIEIVYEILEERNPYKDEDASPAKY